MKYIAMFKKNKPKTSKFNLCNKEGGGGVTFRNNTIILII